MTTHPEERRAEIERLARAWVQAVTDLHTVTSEHYAEQAASDAIDAEANFTAELSRLTFALAAREGYVLVPVEPTEEMLIDGAKAVRDFFSENGPYPRTKAMWRSMITARPTPASGEEKP